MAHRTQGRRPGGSEGYLRSPTHQALSSCSVRSKSSISSRPIASAHDADPAQNLRFHVSVDRNAMVRRYRTL